MNRVRRFIFALVVIVAFFDVAPASWAQSSGPEVISPARSSVAAKPTSTPPISPATGTPLRLNIGLEGAGGQTGEVSVALQIVIVMTLLSVAPSIVLLMTCFTRIVIVLGFVRTAIGTPSAPSNQIMIGLSLFLTFFLMGPIFDRVNTEALRP